MSVFTYYHCIFKIPNNHTTVFLTTGSPDAFKTTLTADKATVGSPLYITAKKTVLLLTPF